MSSDDATDFDAPSDPQSAMDQMEYLFEEFSDQFCLICWMFDYLESMVEGIEEFHGNRPQWDDDD